MNKRHSGIELLKIVAIFLIILSHVLLTLYYKIDYVPYDETYMSTSNTKLTNNRQIFSTFYIFLHIIYKVTIKLQIWKGMI